MRTPRLSAKEVEAVLAHHGFTLASQKGSHRKWWHEGMRRTVIVPSHSARELPLGTMKQIMRTCGLNDDVWA